MIKRNLLKFKIHIWTPCHLLVLLTTLKLIDIFLTYPICINSRLHAHVIKVTFFFNRVLVLNLINLVSSLLTMFWDRKKRPWSLLVIVWWSLTLSIILTDECNFNEWKFYLIIYHKFKNLSILASPGPIYVILWYNNLFKVLYHI